MKVYKLIQHLAKYPANYEVWVKGEDDTGVVLRVGVDHEEKVVEIETDVNQ